MACGQNLYLRVLLASGRACDAQSGWSPCRPLHTPVHIATCSQSHPWCALAPPICRHGSSGVPAEEGAKEGAATTDAKEEGGGSDQQQGGGGESEEEEALRQKAFEGMLVAT